MPERTAGVLLHITSLPSRFGIGDLGPSAYRFIDFLSAAGQGIWQTLPLNPAGPETGNSPYSSASAFAGNPLLISPELLAEDGLLSRSDIRRVPAFPAGRVHFSTVGPYKTALFRRAFSIFMKGGKSRRGFELFCRRHREWLGDFALFQALRGRLGTDHWADWPSPLKNRAPGELRRWGRKLEKEIAFEKFLQFVFFRQWNSLKKYGHAKGIRFFGDLPIYIRFESADVWAHPGVFRLNRAKLPGVVSGVPPDYFSATGQRWGTPLYRWDALKKRKYDWWVRRCRHNLYWFDRVRLDHFIGFVNYWEVPARDATALNGRWRKGPRDNFFRVLRAEFPSLPFIAEDLGVVTPEVDALRRRFGLPGIRLLQFAFENGDPAGRDKPHNYEPNCVAFTGTHDNDTLAGWFSGTAGGVNKKTSDIRREKENALNYLGRGIHPLPQKTIHWAFIRLLMMSAAGTVIIPMQDLLGLGSEARMNRPGQPNGNWEWRLREKQVTPGLVKKLRGVVATYGRGKG